MRNLRLLVILLPVLALSACAGWNSVEHGHRDVLTFTPEDCGRSSCDLDDPIVVGGKVTVRLDAVDNSSVFGLTLISSDPYIMDVYPTDSFGEEYEIVGYNHGWANLIAIDGAGREVDAITIRIDPADHLYLDAVRGDAELVSSTPREIWNVTAGQPVAFDVEASAGSWQMMGRLALDVYLDQTLLDAMDADARLTDGHLSFIAPAGTHDVRFVGLDGTALDVRFVAR
jgi:hypothetical protein